MITKNNNLKVMELLFKHPQREFHIRELARLTGLSSTGIIKIVKKLKKEQLVTSRKERNVELVAPDFEGRFILTKRLYNIWILYDSGLIQLLKKYFEQPEAIILFGSYSQGMDTEKSDIDLAVINTKKQQPDLAKFEAKLNRKITIHQIHIQKAEKEFKNSLANGIVLEGYLNVI